MTQPGDARLFPCPTCNQPTDNLKAYRLMQFVLFIFIYVSVKHAMVVACPSCMRKKLMRSTLINIIPGNLVWVVLVVPANTIAAFRTFTKGHSAPVLKALSQP